MKLLVLLVLLGVSTILVSCQDTATESPDTSDTAAPTSAAAETSNTESGTAAETSNTESETKAESTDEVTDIAPQETQAEEKPKESIVDKGKNAISKLIEKVKKDIFFLG